MMYCPNCETESVLYFNKGTGMLDYEYFCLCCNEEINKFDMKEFYFHRYEIELFEEKPRDE